MSVFVPSSLSSPVSIPPLSSPSKLGRPNTFVGNSSLFLCCYFWILVRSQGTLFWDHSSSQSKPLHRSTRFLNICVTSALAFNNSRNGPFIRVRRLLQVSCSRWSDDFQLDSSVFLSFKKQAFLRLTCKLYLLDRLFTSLFFLVFLFDRWTRANRIARELDASANWKTPFFLIASLAIRKPYPSPPTCFALSSFAFSFECINIQGLWIV